MTREEIIRMAREAGVRVARMLEAMENNEAALTETEARDIAAIERFASLVAEAERNACAKLCEIEASVIVTNASEHYQEGRSMGATVCYNMIMKRSKG